MSELAKSAREAMKAKASRMGGGNDAGSVDASGWEPPKAMNADVKTGMRPISRRQFASGGSVDGEASVGRADKKPRTGNKTVADFVNRDVRAANEDRPGKKHVGGFATGGEVPKTRFEMSGGTSMARKASGLKTGGRAKKAIGGDLSYLSPALMLANSLRGDKDKDKASGLGGILGKKGGGSVSDGAAEGMRPKGGRLARKSGGKTGKTNINIIIGQPKEPEMAPPMPKPPMPMPPMAPPPGIGAPPPMGAGAPPMPPPMARKRGGRTNYDAGAGSGLGRLEKTASYGKNA